MPYTSEVARAVDGYTARTISVRTSLQARQVVLSQAEMEALLSSAKLVALGICDCRQEQKRCDGPLEVCISLDEAAQQVIARRGARSVSLAEALDALRRSHEAGLVHLAFRQGDEAVSQVCSCCSCCCWFLNQLKHFDYHDAIAESEYIAAFDRAECNGCAECIDRCQFGAWTARKLAGEKAVQFDAASCFGCGLCVSTCPTGAITLAPRA
jgi:ferredoxin